MNVRDFKRMVAQIPEEYDDCLVVTSEGYECEEYVAEGLEINPTVMADYEMPEDYAGPRSPERLVTRRDGSTYDAGSDPLVLSLTPRR